MATAGEDPAILRRINAVIESERLGLDILSGSVALQSGTLSAACRTIRTRCGDGAPGRLVITGIGKAGLIARKVSATFASTGTPGLFMHPGEARHGDLGMVQAHDVVLIFSHSGASEEILALIPSLKTIGCPLIAVVGERETPLARHADIALGIGRVTEACHLGLAPSTSTTAMLALGDALALTVQEMREFTPEQYARYHPGGSLGRRLMTCRQAMRSGERLAAVDPGTPVIDALRAITRARSGSVVLVDAAGGLIGIFTDGDLRRLLMRTADPAQVLKQAVGLHGTCPCRSIAADALLQSALRLCAEHRINELPVVGDGGHLVGLLDLQDLVDRGFQVEPDANDG